MNRSWSQNHVMKKENFGSRVTLMKTMSSEARAVVMKRRVVESEKCHVYDSSAALPLKKLLLQKMFLLSKSCA